MTLFLDFILVILVAVMGWSAQKWAHKNKAIILEINKHPFITSFVKHVKWILPFILLLVTALVGIAAWRLMVILIAVGGYGISACLLVLIYGATIWWNCCITLGYSLLNNVFQRFYQ